MLVNKILVLFLTATAIFASQPLFAAEFDGAEKVPLKGESELITLPSNEDFSMPLNSFIQFSSRTLDIPIVYNPHETNDIKIQFSSEVRVQRSEFLGYFERLLLDMGFIHLISGKGNAEVHKVMNMTGLARPNGALAFQSSALVLPLGMLDAYAQRGIIITTTIPLKHLRARDCMTSLMVYFQNSSQFESIRPLESTNSLMITGLAIKVSKIYELIKLSDIASSGDSALSPSIMASQDLMSRIEKLEKKVAALEKQVDENS